MLPRPTLTFSSKNFSPTANPPFSKSSALSNVLSKNNLTVFGNPVDVPAPVALYVRSLIPIPFGFPSGVFYLKRGYKGDTKIKMLEGITFKKKKKIKKIKHSFF